MKYTLVGVDGNAFAIMGYTAKALKAEGLKNLITEMREEAMSGDYYHLIATCDSYIDRANEAAEENGYIDDEEEDFW